MKKAEMKEMAKNILMSQLSMAHYEYENPENLGLYTDVDPEEISQEDLNQVAEYLNKFAAKMAKAVGKEFYQV